MDNSATSKGSTLDRLDFENRGSFPKKDVERGVI